MEHTDIDIANIEFGNKQLNQFLENEEAFRYLVLHSPPYLECFRDVYKTLEKLGELPPYYGNDKNENIIQAKEQAKEWCPNGSETKINAIARCVLVISHLAEKRLSVTTGK